MQTSQPSLRPRLTLVILLFAAVDIVGMVLIATGIMWFAHGMPLFIRDFPTNMVEAGVSVAGGLVMMIWSAAQILRELTKQIGQQNPGRSQ